MNDRGKKMMSEENISELFMDLASESRLDILRTLSADHLKMQDIARKLNLTATEASRQLQRMANAKLIERIADGSYMATRYGTLQLALISSMEFAFRYRDLFIGFDQGKLPVQFIHRLGELSDGELVTELAEGLTRMENIIRNAKGFVWVMTRQVMPAMIRAMEERISSGVRLRSLIYEKPSAPLKDYILSGDLIERRTLPEVNLVLLATEDEAAILLPFSNMANGTPIFFGRDAQFMGWVYDLYSHYWAQGKKWVSTR